MLSRNFFRYRLGGILGSLIWQVASLPVAEGLETDGFFKVSSNSAVLPLDTLQAYCVD